MTALLISSDKIPVIILIAFLFLLLCVLIVLSQLPPTWLLNRIKSQKVGDNQHGNARWLSESDLRKNYKLVPYTPKEWRKGRKLPSSDLRGVIVGQRIIHGRLHAVVMTEDMHTGIFASSGAGKTAYILYPNLEYACATGMSFVTTDTKGDLYRNYGYIAQEFYGYNVTVLDLRNPTVSHGNNILAVVNKYMDIWKDEKVNLLERNNAKSNAEKYAKIIAKSIVFSDSNSSNFGANAFFYEAAEGLLAATILLVSEFGDNGERHIPSVFTLLTELMEYIELPSKSKFLPPQKKLAFAALIAELPTNHKAKISATSAVNGADNTQLSVVTTTLSRLNSFVDSELEQLLCFENEIDVETFCSRKSALFIVLPEEDPTKYFMVSLLLQQFYRECLIYADNNGGKMKDRIMMYLDEIGTIPKINGLDMMFSASRSRNILLMPILQGESQFSDTYGPEKAKTILSNVGCIMYGGFAPDSDLLHSVSTALGNVTVLSGSVSTGTNSSSSVSYQMTNKPLISEQELQRLKKGTFIVRKSNSDPMMSKMMLFVKWGITFPDTYVPRQKTVREVHYLNATKLFLRIREKYRKEVESKKSLSSLLAEIYPPPAPKEKEGTPQKHEFVTPKPKKNTPKKNSDQLGPHFDEVVALAENSDQVGPNFEIEDVAVAADDGQEGSDEIIINKKIYRVKELDLEEN